MHLGNAMGCSNAYRWLLVMIIVVYNNNRPTSRVFEPLPIFGTGCSSSVELLVPSNMEGIFQALLGPRMLRVYWGK